MRTYARQAFTLIEIVIAAAIFTTIATIVSGSMLSGSQWVSRISNESELQETSNRVLDRLMGQLQLAGGSTSQLKIPVPGMSNVYQYRVMTGYDAAGDKTYEDHTISLDTSVEDDGRLMESVDGKPAQELCRGIPTGGSTEPPGFMMTQSGNIVTLSLTLTGRTRTGELLSRTSQGKAVYLRSSIASASGDSPVTSVKEPIDPDDPLSVAAVAKTVGPSIFCGSRERVLATGLDQISILITAPIGQELNTRNLATITVDLNGTSMGAGSAPAYSKITNGIERRDSDLFGCHVITLTGALGSGWVLTVGAEVAYAGSPPTGYRTTVSRTY